MTNATETPAARYANGSPMLRIESPNRNAAVCRAASLADTVGGPADGSRAWVAVMIEITPVCSGFWGNVTTIFGVITLGDYRKTVARGRRTKTFPDRMFRDGDSIVEVTGLISCSELY